MESKFVLTITFTLASFFTFAQQEKMTGREVELKLKTTSLEELKLIENSSLIKAPGDTLFYEDFGTGFSTNGWVSNNVSQNGFDWIYTTAAPGGQYSGNIAAIASTTGANGFASLRSDFYNTPTPSGGFFNMDTYLTSGPIVISPKSNILLRWQQSFRYCCATSAALEVQVSPDSINWTNYSAKASANANTATTGSFQVNISAAAANQGTLYIRFYQDASHYYWMIDDIAIVEGAPNQLELTRSLSSFGPIDREGFFTLVPALMTQPLSFRGEIKNDGGLIANNTKLKVNVTKNNAMVYSDSVATKPILLPQESVVVDIVRPFNNTNGTGDYEINYSAESNTASADISRTKRSIDFTVTDTIFGKDYNLSGGGIGPGSFVDGDAAGSRIGTRYNLKAGAKLTSVSYFISTSTLNIGAEIKAKVWGFDTSQASLNDAINVPGIKAQNPIPYIIQASDLGTWVTFNILPAPVLLPMGMYVAAVEQNNANSSTIDFTIGRSTSSEGLQPNSENSNYSSYVYTAGSAAPTWGPITVLPMIRMNFGELLPVGIYETEEMINSFVVSPNPSSGQFNVQITAESAQLILSVRNMIGQVVYIENISVINSLTKSINLTNLDKGIYFISLENGVKREVQKVIIQ